MTEPKRMSADDLNGCLVVLDDGFPRITEAIASHIKFLDLALAEATRPVTDEIVKGAIAQLAIYRDTEGVFGKAAFADELITLLQNLSREVDDAEELRAEENRTAASWMDRALAAEARATTAEKALAEARENALEEAAVICDQVTQRCFDQRDQQKVGAFDCAVELAAAIRSLQTEQKP